MSPINGGGRDSGSHSGGSSRRNSEILGQQRGGAVGGWAGHMWLGGAVSMARCVGGWGCVISCAGLLVLNKKHLRKHFL